jgi:hypothetical protein
MPGEDGGAGTDSGSGSGSGSSSSSSGGSSSSSSSSSGGSSSSGSSSGSGADAGTLSFSKDIYTIINNSCALACHNPSYANGTAGGVDMMTGGAAGAYAQMVNQPPTAANSASCSSTNLPKGLEIVVPANSAQSLLYNKIASAEPGGPATICGSAMPIGVPLPPSSVALIKRWIDEGANP